MKFYYLGHNVELANQNSSLISVFNLIFHPMPEADPSVLENNYRLYSQAIVQVQKKNFKNTKKENL